jgi:hypothetical protein
VIFPCLPARYFERLTNGEFAVFGDVLAFGFVVFPDGGAVALVLGSGGFGPGGAMIVHPAMTADRTQAAAS